MDSGSELSASIDHIRFSSKRVDVRSWDSLQQAVFGVPKCADRGDQRRTSAIPTNASLISGQPRVYAKSPVRSSTPAHIKPNCSWRRPMARIFAAFVTLPWLSWPVSLPHSPVRRRYGLRQAQRLRPEIRLLRQLRGALCSGRKPAGDRLPGPPFHRRDQFKHPFQWREQP
jgi:hypothetical protein